MVSVEEQSISSMLLGASTLSFYDEQAKTVSRLK